MKKKFSVRTLCMSTGRFIAGAHPAFHPLERKTEKGKYLRLRRRAGRKKRIAKERERERESGERVYLIPL